VERGLNEHELGAIVRHGLAHVAVRSVAFQPVTHSGRHVEFDPLTRLTKLRRQRAAGRATPGVAHAGSFPVPCCFPTCRSITYLLTDGTPGTPDFAVVPIPRLLNVEDYLDYVTNRVVPDYAIREALVRLWSASAFMGTAATEDRLAVTAAALDCGDACVINLPEAVNPGDWAGITDITADGARLPAELRSLAAWVACVADAHLLEGYAAMLTATGLRVTRMERHDAAVARMIDQIEARLTVVR
jgi:uncharacterized radical SAM superfamily Fe-S cluster-containing enzyme